MGTRSGNEFVMPLLSAIITESKGRANSFKLADLVPRSYNPFGQHQEIETSGINQRH